MLVRACAEVGAGRVETFLTCKPVSRRHPRAFRRQNNELRWIPIGESKSQYYLSELTIRHPVYGFRSSPSLRFQGPNGSLPVFFFPASGQGCRRKGAPARGSEPLLGYINSAGGLSSRLGGRPPNWNETGQQVGQDPDDMIRSTKTVSKSFPSPFLCAQGTSVRGTGTIPLSQF